MKTTPLIVPNGAVSGDCRQALDLKGILLFGVAG
jgi:hypothetical protein